MILDFTVPNLKSPRELFETKLFYFPHLNKSSVKVFKMTLHYLNVVNLKSLLQIKVLQLNVPNLKNCHV